MTKLRVRNFGEPERVLEVTFFKVPHYSSSEHRGRVLSAYEVSHKGRVIGKIYEETQQCERKTRGARYVNARWTGSKTVWKPTSATGGRSCHGRFDTRAEAAAWLLGYSFCNIIRGDARA